MKYIVWHKINPPITSSSTTTVINRYFFDDLTTAEKFKESLIRYNTTRNSYFYITSE